MATSLTAHVPITRLPDCPDCGQPVTGAYTEAATLHAYITTDGTGAVSIYVDPETGEPWTDVYYGDADAPELARYALRPVDQGGYARVSATGSVARRGRPVVLRNAPEHDVHVVEPCGHRHTGPDYKIAAINASHPDVKIKVSVTIPPGPLNSDPIPFEVSYGSVLDLVQSINAPPEAVARLIGDHLTRAAAMLGEQLVQRVAREPAA